MAYFWLLFDPVKYSFTSMFPFKERQRFCLVIAVHQDRGCSHFVKLRPRRDKFYNKVIGTSHLGLFCCFNTHLALAVCMAQLIRDKSSSWHGSLGNAHQFLSQDLSVLVG